MEHEKTLPRDEFSVARRELANHPEAVQATSRIDVADPYGNVTTWVLDLVRVNGSVTAFVQRIDQGGAIRIVVPGVVNEAITRHHAGLITKQRRKTARRVAHDRIARGDTLGNPEALRRARSASRKGRKP